MGIFTVANYTNKQENNRVAEVAGELQAESGKILDYGASTGNYPWDSFTKNFTYYSGGGLNIVYAVGNYSNFEVFNYAAGSKNNVAFVNVSNVITINLNDNNYTFKLKPGENFYFIVTQEIGSNKYVETNFEQ